MAAGAMLAMTGCSLNWTSMSPNVGQATPSATAGPTVKPTQPIPAAPTPTVRLGGDLATGSVTHKLAAGSHQLVVDYWTEKRPSTSTHTTPIAVHLTAHIENGDREHAINVTRFVAVAQDGSTKTSLVDDRGEFVLTPPYSYGSAVIITPTPESADIVVAVQFDLLVETTPGTKAFFRQTVLDTLRITLSAISIEE